MEKNRQGPTIFLLVLGLAATTLQPMEKVAAAVAGMVARVWHAALDWA